LLYATLGRTREGKKNLDFLGGGARGGGDGKRRGAEGPPPARLPPLSTSGPDRTGRRRLVENWSFLEDFRTEGGTTDRLARRVVEM